MAVASYKLVTGALVESWASWSIYSALGQPTGTSAFSCARLGNGGWK